MNKLKGDQASEVAELRKKRKCKVSDIEKLSAELAKLRSREQALILQREEEQKVSCLEKNCETVTDALFRFLEDGCGDDESTKALKWESNLHCVTVEYNGYQSNFNVHKGSGLKVSSAAQIGYNKAYAETLPHMSRNKNDRDGCLECRHNSKSMQDIIDEACMYWGIRNKDVFLKDSFDQAIWPPNVPLYLALEQHRNRRNKKHDLILELIIVQRNSSNKVDSKENTVVNNSNELYHKNIRETLHFFEFERSRFMLWTRLVFLIWICLIIIFVMANSFIIRKASYLSQQLTSENQVNNNGLLNFQFPDVVNATAIEEVYSTFTLFRNLNDIVDIVDFWNFIFFYYSRALGSTFFDNVIVGKYLQIWQKRSENTIECDMHPSLRPSSMISSNTQDPFLDCPMCARSCDKSSSGTALIESTQPYGAAVAYTLNGFTYVGKEINIINGSNTRSSIDTRNFASNSLATNFYGSIISYKRWYSGYKVFLETYDEYFVATSFLVENDWVDANTRVIFLQQTM